MKKQKTKIWMIVMIVAALLVLAVIIVDLVAGAGGDVSSSGIKRYDADEYLKAMNKEQITGWFEEAGSRSDTAYVLRHKGDSPLEYDAVYHYAVYIPGIGKDSMVGLGTAGLSLAPYLKLELEAGGQAGTIFGITLHTNKKMGFRVYLDEKRINTEILDVDFDPLPAIE